MHTKISLPLTAAQAADFLVVNSCEHLHTFVMILYNRIFENLHILTVMTATDHNYFDIVLYVHVTMAWEIYPKSLPFTAINLSGSIKHIQEVKGVSLVLLWPLYKFNWCMITISLDCISCSNYAIWLWMLCRKNLQCSLKQHFQLTWLDGWTYYSNVNKI